MMFQIATDRMLRIFTSKRLHVNEKQSSPWDIRRFPAHFWQWHNFCEQIKIAELPFMINGSRNPVCLWKQSLQGFKLNSEHICDRIILLREQSAHFMPFPLVFTANMWIPLSSAKFYENKIKMSNGEKFLKRFPFQGKIYGPFQGSNTNCK